MVRLTQIQSRDYSPGESLRTLTSGLLCGNVKGSLFFQYSEVFCSFWVLLIIPRRCMGCCSSHFFAGDQKPRLQGGLKNRELSFCAPQVMKRNCTGLWTVLFCTEESILWRCILLWFCSDALCQKTRSHPVVWGRGSP